MKILMTVMLILTANISMIYSHSTESYILESRIDSTTGIVEDKEYTIKFIIKKYDVTEHVTFEGEEPDRSNPSYCLWTVTIPAQNFDAMLKIGAIKFTDIRDNSGSTRGQLTDDLPVSRHADPSIINNDEFKIAVFLHYRLYYKIELLTGEELEEPSKAEIADIQKQSLLIPSDNNNNNNYAGNKGTFTDNRDGKTYKWVKIGNQTWMAENLAYKPSSENYWAHDNDQNNASKYGYLYDWQTAQEVAPPGWHLPSKSEFETLLNNFGGSGEKTYNALIKGGNSDINILFAGWRSNYGNFDGIGHSTGFWSATESDSTYAWNCYLYAYYKNAGMDSNNKRVGLSVRLLRD